VTGGMWRGEEGQALVIVGLAMVVLMGALALSIDWGYGLAMRRVSQNQADAAALAAGRYLASTTGPAGTFEVNTQPVGQEDVWCEAERARAANVTSAPTAATHGLAVTFRASDGSELATATSGNCSITGSGPAVPAATRQIQVRATVTYGSLLGIATPRQVLVAATARAQLTGAQPVRQLELPPRAAERPGLGLSGSSTRPNVALWPIVRHLTSSDFARTPCGGPCVAGGGAPVTFWPASRSDQAFGSFTGLVSYGNYSLREPAHQMVTESDYTGTANGRDQGHIATPLLFNQGDASCGPTWDTNGGPGASRAIPCDLPNWFSYGFRGSLALGTDWSDGSWGGFLADGPVDVPEPLPTAPSSRSSCRAPAFFSTPSCEDPAGVGSSARGDWVETVAGAPTSAMVAGMHSFIARYGRSVPGTGLGKAVVVNIFLWDCAEQFTGRPADRWQLVLPRSADEGADGPDCSQIQPKDSRRTPIDRVHLFTVVPFTFYDDLIQLDRRGNATVQAFWGDVFGDAGICQAIPLPATGQCQLNPLTNSAFLVPDE